MTDRRPPENEPTLLLCDCGGTQRLDGKAIARATGLVCPNVHSGLCTSGLKSLSAVLRDGGAVVACEQEAAVFSDLAAELEVAAPLSVDIRDRAGWSDQADAAMPKMAALIAEARLDRPASKAIDVESHGLCLVIGAADIALPAAEQLEGVLDVTCLLTDAGEVIPGAVRMFDVVAGRARSASGFLGNFSVTVDGLRTVDPSGRGALTFSEPRDGAKSECDLILDLTGGTPLFPAPDKRDGYLRPDPRDPLAVARAVFDAAQMFGTFEKTLHVRLEDHLCAHSRAGQSGCNRCLDVCPTGAIAPDGDSVSVDAHVCAGCGSCSAVCPSGAIGYDDPPVTCLYTRIPTLAGAYRSAGATAPRLLVHDPAHGREMIALAARFGRGIPADVIPLAVPNLAGFGHAEMLVALASGFAAVDVLAGPSTERDALDPQLELASSLASGLGIGDGRLRVIEPADPDALSDFLYAADAPGGLTVSPILPLGSRREVTRLAARTLAQGPAAGSCVPLPAGAPYGGISIDTEACTLCLSCVSLCPSGALGDNPGKPLVSFQEDACLQCGICAGACPENAIALVPQLNLGDDALSQIVLHEEEPFECIACGKPFGVRSSIERVAAKLEGLHPMFTGSDNAKLIRMCEDCRVKAQFHSENSPMAGGERPRVRTTDDYLDGKKPN
ncbi:MAG: 4Fe-4S binding protein [Paracoccaceae bacterium]